MIVHLIQSAPDLAGSGWRARETWASGDAGLVVCAGVARALPGIEHRVLLIGGSGDAARARLLGLRGRRIAPALGSARLASRGIARWMRGVPADAAVICWGGPLGEVFRRACPDRRGVMWADLDAGVLRSPTMGPVSLPAVLGPPRDTADDRMSVRRRLGLSDDETVLAMLDDPPGDADAVGMVFVAGVLRVAGVKATILFDRRNPAGEAAVRHADDIGYLRRVISIDAPAAWFLPAADVGVIGPRQDARRIVAGFGSMLNLHNAAARGIPAVLPGDCITRFLLPEAMHSLLAASARPTDLARRLLPLLTDDAAFGAVKRACAEWAAKPGLTLGSVIGGCLDRLGDRATRCEAANT